MTDDDKALEGIAKRELSVERAAAEVCIARWVAWQQQYGVRDWDQLMEELTRRFALYLKNWPRAPLDDGGEQ